jgi:hypothetical protein
MKTTCQLKTACCLLLLLLLLLSLAGRAQDITTMWPYAYPEFVKGTVYFADSSTLQAPVNVHLQKSRLHYLEQGTIKEAKSADIVLVDVGADRYFVRRNELLHVLAGNAQAFLATLTLADFSAITEPGGAYGASSNVQATRKLSSIDIGGVSITNHVELKSKKDAGTLLPVSVKYFLVTGDEVYPATRKGIAGKLSGERKDAFNRFVKQHKIKWSNPESLITLLDFFTQENTPGHE